MRPSIRFEVFKRDAFTCIYCGRRSPEVLLEVDHILARAKGGTDELENLVTACAECNRGKGDRPLDTPPGIDLKDRADRLAEQERQIAEYARWKAHQRAREDQEIAALADVYAKAPRATFHGTEGDTRWFWQEIQVRNFLRRLGYHDVLEAIEITAARSRTWRGDDRGAAEDVWRYFCGVCWRRIKEPQR